MARDALGGSSMKFKARELSKQLTSREFQLAVVMFWTQRCQELLQERNNLKRDDLEYLAEKASKMKDERMAHCISSLIGWGDDDRAELETFCAIALQVMKQASPSKLREAAMTVELRFLMNQENEHGSKES
jgi:hypothetical protein